MAKNHYVPRLILRKFASLNHDRICTYNVSTGELLEDLHVNQCYYEKDIYTDQVEQDFSKKIETKFGDFLVSNILEQTDTITLSRKQILLIKKFLLSSIFRSKSSLKFLEEEKDSLKLFKLFPEFKDFEEKIIENETIEDYWMRTLNVILDSDGSPESILKNPKRTFPAYRWSLIINSGYLAFWNSDSSKDEFVITDIGMTSENEKGWDGKINHNHKKIDFLLRLMEHSKNDFEKAILYNTLNMCNYFHENFQMFPISSKRMIVLISPFFKFYYSGNYNNLLNLSTLTLLDNDALFYPNQVEYKKPQSGLVHDYDDEDKYIYKIKKLNSKEVQYCNALFMDRIDTYLGFSNLNNVVKSVLKYKKLNSSPYVPRVKYDKLYEIIDKRYNG